MAQNSAELLEQHLATNAYARIEWDTTFKLDADPRVTKIGNLLRKTSLDELPQFFNVFTGEMSVVGPRPVTLPEIAMYGDSADAVLKARPGVTGPWQVSGRNDITYDERVAIDREYVRKITFIGDVKTIVRTVLVMLKMTGK